MVKSFCLFVDNNFELKALFLDKAITAKQNDNSKQRLALSIKKSIQTWIDSAEINIDRETSNLELALSQLGSIELLLKSMLQHSLVNDTTEADWEVIAEHYLRQLEFEEEEKIEEEKDEDDISDVDKYLDLD